MANPVAFPNRPFNLRASVWLISQDITSNRSRLGWQLWVDKVSYSPTFSGGKAHRWMTVNGGYVHENYGNGFDFRNGSNFLLGSGEVWVPHNADGTKTVPIAAAADFDILGATPTLTASVTLPTIPRASTATFVGGATFDAGTTVTINTNRASSSFTHDITYEFGAATGTIATGVGASTTWTPPLTLLQQIPNNTSGTGRIKVVTKNGSSTIGTKYTSFTLRAGAAIVPTIASLTVVDDNPTVQSLVGAFVQNLSILKAVVNASGIQGSTITASSFKIGSTSAPSGGSIPITSSGTVEVTATATDSRGRTGSFVGSITVLPYADPHFDSVLVRRSNASGVVAEEGTYLRVDLKCAVQSIINSTERNSLTIRVYTRPRGGTTWTPRNVIDHSALSYDDNFVVSGGANYPIDESFDVRVEISDKFKTAAAQTVVATAAVLMHWSKTGVGFGKFHENGTVDVNGDVFASGNMRSRGGGIDSPTGAITAFAGTVAPQGWLLCDGSAVSRTTYADLFAVIGTAYGAGNGTSTFNLPNLQGRVPVGRNGSEAEFDELGDSGGEKEHTLTVDEMPTHSHSLTYQGSSYGSFPLLQNVASPHANVGWGAGAPFSPSRPISVANAGRGQAHNNLQPYLVVNYIIRT